jgi:hypothetical protein
LSGNQFLPSVLRRANLAPVGIGLTDAKHLK